MNKVILSGRLVKDIEVRKSPNGESVVSNTIAVSRDFKNSKGEYETDFINFVAWRQTADYLSNYAKKGDRAELVGRWQVRKYTNRDNVEVTVNEVIVESMTVFNTQPREEKKEEQKPQENQNLAAVEVTDDDLPF